MGDDARVDGERRRDEALLPPPETYTMNTGKAVEATYRLEHAEAERLRWERAAVQWEKKFHEERQKLDSVSRELAEAKAKATEWNARCNEARSEIERLKAERDELARQVACLKVDIAGRSKITLEEQHKKEVALLQLESMTEDKRILSLKWKDSAELADSRLAEIERLKKSLLDKEQMIEAFEGTLKEALKRASDANLQNGELRAALLEASRLLTLHVLRDLEDKDVKAFMPRAEALCTEKPTDGCPRCSLTHGQHRPDCSQKRSCAKCGKATETRHQETSMEVFQVCAECGTETPRG